MRNDQTWVCASSKAESGDTDDTAMADQREVTTQVYGKIPSNTQIRECAESRRNTECVCQNE